VPIPRGEVAFTRPRPAGGGRLGGDVSVIKAQIQRAAAARAAA
jgi:hypothetical protein